MAQNIYDNAEFFAGYGQLRRSQEGLAGAPEWPSLQAQLPALNDLRVVDLGCGYGWFCRWAAEQGAASVLGLDVSQKMLERATSSNNAQAIEYRRTDLETLTLPPATFDLAYSSLALHYIEDLPRLLGTVLQALTPGGRLLFSIEHPIYMAPANPGWLTRADGGRSWPVDCYQVEGVRTTDWLAKGVIKYHRTLGTVLNTLIGCGFTLRHVEEWGPTAEQLAAQPSLADERERPMLLIVAAERAQI